MALADLAFFKDLLRFNIEGTARVSRRLHTLWLKGFSFVDSVVELDLVKHRRINQDIGPQSIKVSKCLTIDPHLLDLYHLIELN